MSPRPTEPKGFDSTAARHAARVLEDLGMGAVTLPSFEAPDPDSDWARSGCARLSGPAPAPVAACVRGAWVALTALAPALAQHAIDPPSLLGERAAAASLESAGRDTAGGAGRLVRVRDGWIAVQLPRPEDVAALPAWLECDGSLVEAGDPPLSARAALDRIEPLVADRESASLVERARWLGLAVAPLPGGDDADLAAIPWVTRTPPSRPSAARAPGQPLRVLDLSTLWAGPLCGRLLAWAGADVVKVEHPRRVDGARLGPTRFFDAMNGAKSMVALDASDTTDRARLLDLVRAADVVIESARPRGLAQLGIDAEALVEAQPGLVWISITGYGRPAPRGEWVAFGDDAAVAAGLVGFDVAGAPRFCGDAIADPLTGVHAAVAALAGVRLGGGLFDLPLAGVARMVRETPFVEARAEADTPDARAPHSPVDATPEPAREVGADTEAVLTRWLGASASPGHRARAPAC